MQENNQYDYGSLEWFKKEYNKVNEDPWGLSWRPSQMVRYARILALLDHIAFQPLNILDIGCATGDFTNLLKIKYGGTSSVIGVDFIEDAIKRAKNKYPQLQCRMGSIFDVGGEYSGQMDLVTCLELLYYIEKNKQINALTSIKEALRPGGYVMFSSFISKPPYFSLCELCELVSTKFIVVETKTIHVKFLSILERAMMKILKHVGGIEYLENTGVIGGNITSFPVRIADYSEKSFSHLGNISLTHALVLGKSN